MSNKIEHRTTAEVRAGVAFEVCGRALTYNQPSSDLGGFRELHLPGVFTRALASGAADVKCLQNHDANLILGRQANGTLTLTDSPQGLDFVCKLNPASQQHRDLYQNVKSKLMNQCSFAFAVDNSDGEGDSFSGPDKNGLLTRTVKRAKLFDVSIVCSPAFPGDATSVAARAATEHSVVSDQTGIKRHIAAYEMRRLFKKYPGIALEDLAPRIRTYGEGTALEDALNQFRAAQIDRQIRSGWAFSDGGGFAANSPRDAYNGGAAADPTQSLRDDDDFDDADWWNDDDKQKDDDWDDQRHLRCCQYHRNRAACSATMYNVSENHRCADLHVKAASGGSVDDSRIARVASRKLCLGDIS